MKKPSISPEDRIRNRLDVIAEGVYRNNETRKEDVLWAVRTINDLLFELYLLNKRLPIDFFNEDSEVIKCLEQKT